jgi:hypothetical protein
MVGFGGDSGDDNPDLVHGWLPQSEMQRKMPPATARHERPPGGTVPASGQPEQRQLDMGLPSLSFKPRLAGKCCQGQGGKRLLTAVAVPAKTFGIIPSGGAWTRAREPGKKEGKRYFRVHQAG